MSIAPLVNAGTTPSVRRPRKSQNETAATTGPFSLTLFATGTETEHLSQGIGIASTRVAITADETPPTTQWGQDFACEADVPVAGVLVGYVWIRSVDTNGDGYDDLEAAGSVTLSDAFAILSDGIVSSAGIGGIGALAFAGYGALTAKNPMGGVGSLSLTGSGILAVIGGVAGTGALGLTGYGLLAAKNPMGGTGIVGLAGSGAVTNTNPLGGIGSLGIVGAGALTVSASAPGQVTGLTLTPGQTSIAASWSVPTGSPTSYHVQYKQHSSGTWLDWGSDPTTNAATITGLTQLTDYDVRVKAHNATGDGAYSTTTTTTTTGTVTGTFWWAVDPTPLQSSAQTGTEQYGEHDPYSGPYTFYVKIGSTVVGTANVDSTQGGDDVTVDVSLSGTTPSGQNQVFADFGADGFSCSLPSGETFAAGKAVTGSVRITLSYDSDNDVDVGILDYAHSHITVAS